MPSPMAQLDRFARWEVPCLVAVLLVVLAVNLATGDRCPAVWLDEAAYTDPAWNLASGRGFTSSAWYAQDADEFWAGNVPLHPALLCAWMGMFGRSVLAVRAMNYALMTVAAALLWLAVKRLGLVARPHWRIALVALVMSGFGVSFSYRSARPDAVCILLACAAAAAYSIERATIRRVVLVALGVLFPMAALQLVLFAALLCAVLAVFLRSKYLAEAFALASGCVAGLLVLLALYQYHGVWDDFVASTLGQHSALGQEGFAGAMRRWHIPGGLKDPSLLLVLSAALGMGAWPLLRREFMWRSSLGFALVAGIAIPTALYALRGQFPCYYTWMAYLPLCVGVTACSAAVSAEPRTTEQAGRLHYKNANSALLTRIAAVAVLALACLVGLPLAAALSVVEWTDRDYGLVGQLVAGQVRGEDRVYCDGAAYYAVKDRAAVDVGYRRLESMTPHERQQVSVLVIDPERLPPVQRILGGRWRPCGPVLRPSRAPLLGIRSEYFFDRYTLQVFRRKNAETLLARGRNEREEAVR